MQVIFLQSVPGVAKVGEAKNVSDGYAINYLLPKKLAVMATAQKIRELTKEKEKIIKKQEQREKQLAGWVGQLNDKVINIVIQAAAGGTLYAAIDRGTIVKDLEARFHLIVKPEQVIMNEPIKKVGDHPVVIRFSISHEAHIIIKVEAKDHGKN